MQELSERGFAILVAILLVGSGYWVATHEREAEPLPGGPAQDDGQRDTFPFGLGATHARSGEERPMAVPYRLYLITQSEV